MTAENPEVPDVEVQVESCGLTYGCALFGCLPREEAANDEDEEDDGAILLVVVSIEPPQRSKREHRRLPSRIRARLFCDSHPDVGQHSPSELAPMPYPPALIGQRKKVGEVGW